MLIIRAGSEKADGTASENYPLGPPCSMHRQTRLSTRATRPQRSPELCSPATCWGLICLRSRFWSSRSSSFYKPTPTVIRRWPQLWPFIRSVTMLNRYGTEAVVHMDITTVTMPLTLCLHWSLLNWNTTGLFGYFSTFEKLRNRAILLTFKT